MTERYYPTKRQIARDIVSIARCFTTLTDSLMEKSGIARGENGYMIRIIENSGCNQKDLARKIKVNKTAVSKAITILNDNKYITREKDPLDKRNYIIKPTEKLMDKYFQLYSPLFELSKIGFEGFSDEEIDEYQKMTRRIKYNISKHWLKEFGYSEDYLEVDIDD